MWKQMSSGLFKFCNLQTILTNVFARAGFDTRSILTGLNSGAVCSTKVGEPSLLYYLIITGERTTRFKSFPRVLALREMRTASSISYDGNHYTTNDSILTNPIHLIYMYKQDLAVNNLQRWICHKTQPTNLLCLERHKVDMEVMDSGSHAFKT